MYSGRKTPGMRGRPSHSRWRRGHASTVSVRIPAPILAPNPDPNPVPPLLGARGSPMPNLPAMITLTRDSKSGGSPFLPGIRWAKALAEEENHGLRSQYPQDHNERVDGGIG